MIRPLRKRHLQIWSAWALLLPLGIIGATMARKPMPVSNRIAAHQPLSPVVIATTEWNGNQIELRGQNAETINQLVWLNKKALNVPTAALYMAPTNTASVKTATYIGRIETRGDYAFNLEQPLIKPFYLVVYDFIHEKIVARIALNSV